VSANVPRRIVTARPIEHAAMPARPAYPWATTTGPAGDRGGALRRRSWPSARTTTHPGLAQGAARATRRGPELEAHHPGPRFDQRSEHWRRQPRSSVDLVEEVRGVAPSGVFRRTGRARCPRSKSRARARGVWQKKCHVSASAQSAGEVGDHRRAPRRHSRRPHAMEARERRARRSAPPPAIAAVIRRPMVPGRGVIDGGRARGGARG